ncbi:MAG TPA: hypothetical protein GX500_03055 [Firmicutes bacterium]|nr:hypothetical protein [Candidatus Fermentithermobacillaceae bacterium]
MQAEQVIKALLEQVAPPTPLPAKIVDYVVGEIMRTRSAYSKMFGGPEEPVDEVYLEILPASHRPRIRQWWVQDARLKTVALSPRGEILSASTLGLTGVSRAALKMDWRCGIGKLAIYDSAGRRTVIRQAVPFHRDAKGEILAPRVKRFLSLARLVQEHVL